MESRTKFGWLTTIVLLAAIGALISQDLGDARFARDHITIHAIYDYDVSDPALVFGDASFVVVATVEEELGPVEDEMTAFRIVVRETLKGQLPRKVEITQDGFRRDETTWSLAEFPLMEVGRTYVIALTIPAPAWNQDRLHALPLDTDDRLLPGPEPSVPNNLLQAMQQARYPDTAPQVRDRWLQEIKAWLSAHPAYATPGPADLPKQQG